MVLPTLYWSSVPKTEITKYEDGQLFAMAVIGIHDGTFSELAIGCDATGDEENEG